MRWVTAALFLSLLFPVSDGAPEALQPEEVRNAFAESQDTIFGIDAEDISDERMNIVLDSIRASGASWIRIYALWRYIELHPPLGEYANSEWGTLTGRHRYNWQHLDALVDGAVRRGINVYITNMWAPQWANGADPDCNPFEGANLTCGNIIGNAGWYADFVYNEAAHFKGRVRYYGVWNEPNDGHFFNGPRDGTYLNAFMAYYAFPARQALKAADPAAKLVGPELSMGTGIPSERAEWDTGWLEPIMKYFPDIFDVFSIHNHSDSHDDAKARAERVRELMIRYDPKKEFWMTEYGVNTCEVDGEEQAEQMRLAYVDTLNRSSWWKKTFYYTYADNDGNACGAGLYTSFDRGFSPRPAYMEYKILTGR